ncbi:MAG: TonB-dependent receptor [Candidatus Glassbacteria bacterium]|nr:TonB-dependent receptor [Candidatus Glassbacteria bacterium]
MYKKLRIAPGAGYLARLKYLVISLQLLCLLLPASGPAPGFAQSAGAARQDIKGYVRDRETSEALPFANVLLKGTPYGAATNTDGYFVIVNAPVGKCTLQVKYIGFATQEVEVENVKGEDRTLEIGMKRVVVQLEGITVEGEVQTLDATENVSQVVMAPQELLALPNVGEVDIFRSLQLLPGISGVSDGSSGLYVRGGTPDQNLILFDGMTIYHVDHFFGMFSAFNADAIKDIRVYKGGYPAEFGGRISSVVNLTGKTGDANYTRYGFGINLLSGNGVLEIPLSDKGSFLFSARRSYTDVVKSSLYNSLFDFVTGDQNSAQPAFNVGGNMNRPGGMGSRNIAMADADPDFYFYDINSKVTLNPTSRDIFALSFYRGKDNLNQSQELGGRQFGFRGEGGSSFFADEGLSRQTEEYTTWGNTGVSAKWSRKMHDRLYSNFMVSYSSYFSTYDRNQGFSTDPTAVDDSLNFFRGNRSASEEDNEVEDLTIRLDNEWHLTNTHNLKIGMGLSRFNSHYFATMNDSVSLLGREARASQGFLYLQDSWEITPVCELTFGLRENYYGKTGSSYLEPRAAVVYHLTENVKLKGAWGQYHQFINRITNENVLEGSRDFWILADEELEPNFAEHYIGGVSYEKPGFLFDVEGYYKDLDNLVEYTRRIFRPNVMEESRVRGFFQGTGSVRGVEFLLQKKTGRLTGWLGYTLSKVEYDFPELSTDPFPASHDRTHEINLVGKYSLGNWDLAATWVYATGKPYTAPESQYFIELLDGNSSSYIHVSDKNGYRLPAYHRLDASISRSFYTHSNKFVLGFSIFNLYNNENVWYRQYDLDTQPVTVTDVKMLGFTPTVYLQVYSR